METRLVSALVSLVEEVQIVLKCKLSSFLPAKLLKRSPALFRIFAQFLYIVYRTILFLYKYAVHVNCVWLLSVIKLLSFVIWDEA